MSTIGTNAEDLILNADGSGSDIKFKSNGTEVGSISDGGVMTATSFAGSGAALTGVGVAGISSSADATAITISSAEKVGIGETSPTTHLLCLGEDSGSGDSGASSGISFRASNTENYISMSTVGGGNNGARGLVINRESSNELIKFCGDGRGLSQFTAKAWISFKGTGTVSIHESHNVSSLGDNGTGKQRVNFANNMSSANYSVSGTARRNSRVFSESDDHNRVTNYVDTCVAQSWTASGEDQEVVSVLVFGE